MSALHPQFLSHDEVAERDGLEARPDGLEDVRVGGDGHGEIVAQVVRRAA